MRELLLLSVKVALMTNNLRRALSKNWTLPSSQLLDVVVGMNQHQRQTMCVKAIKLPVEYDDGCYLAPSAIR